MDGVPWLGDRTRGKGPDPKRARRIRFTLARGLRRGTAPRVTGWIRRWRSDAIPRGLLEGVGCIHDAQPTKAADPRQQEAPPEATTAKDRGTKTSGPTRWEPGRLEAEVAPRPALTALKLSWCANLLTNRVAVDD